MAEGESRAEPSAPVQPRDRWQFVRFVVVGVVNTGFAYGAYVLFVWLGLGYATANLLALILGIAFSFTTQGRLVFKETSKRRLWRFILVWAVIYLVNTALIGLFISWGFNAYVAGAMALPINTALSYVAQKYFVFRRSGAA